MSTLAFFSGVESTQHYKACVEAGVIHVLTSYYQFYSSGNLDFVKKRKQANPEINFMVDSGAHTFISDYGKFSSWSRPDFENYVKGYANWLDRNREYLFAGVEFDIDYTLNMLFGGGVGSSIGTSIVEGWQQKYFAPLEVRGLPIIYVWHKERDLQGWEDMCAKFGYVGLPGEMSSDPDFNKYITVARRYTTKIHGFGCSKQADFRDWPWYSNDAITWKTAEMYGTLIHWDKAKQVLMFDPIKTNRAQYRRSFEEHRLPADLIIADGLGEKAKVAALETKLGTKAYKEVTKYALISMRSMEKFYEQKYKDRIFYYQMRLPHVQYIKTMPKSEVFEWWKLLRPEQLFKDHATELTSKVIRQFLIGISAIQNGMPQLLLNAPEASKFMENYFSKLMLPQITDLPAFQRELAIFLSPPNPPPLPRLDRSQYLPSNNAPKMREDSFELEDLEYDFAGVDFKENEI